MSNKFRLSSGGEINRTERISFKFNGKKYFGYKGDTLASALLANGVHLVARSFKYHRPRGFLGSGSEEPNAIVQVLKIMRKQNRIFALRKLKFLKDLRLRVKIVGLMLTLILEKLIICFPLFFQPVFIIKLLCGLQNSGKLMNILLENLRD